MHAALPRHLAATVDRDLRQFPVVAILGPRQCGKTTLAKEIVRQATHRRRKALYLDLEKPSDVAMLRDPETFFRRHADELLCLDEIQRVPSLFEVIRAIIDEGRRPGRFLILGSASPELLRQSSESLAGRISLTELTPFVLGEVLPKRRASQSMLWLRGGFPDSLLASTTESSFRWRQQFIKTFLERDIPQLGFRVPAATLHRFWQMCAHLQGQVLNLSALGRSLGSTHTAARHHLDMLEQTFILRTLPPLEANLGKRLVKSPKLYLRDSGLLHALLGLENDDDLAGHPVYGPSWEGFAIEQILAMASSFHASFFRTATGDELDLVLEKGRRRIAIECKAGSSPTVTRGFWSAIKILGIREAYVVANVRSAYPLGQGVEVIPLGDLPKRL